MAKPTASSSLLSEERIAQRVAHWRGELEIDPAFEIRWNLHESSDAMPKGCKDHPACVDVDLDYQRAAIDFNIEHMRKHEYDAEDIDDVVCHELVHILMAMLASVAKMGLSKRHKRLARMLEESAVSKVTTIVRKLEKRGRR